MKAERWRENPRGKGEGGGGTRGKQPAPKMMEGGRPARPAEAEGRTGAGKDKGRGNCGNIR